MMLLGAFRAVQTDFNLEMLFLRCVHHGSCTLWLFDFYILFVNQTNLMDLDKGTSEIR